MANSQKDFEIRKALSWSAIHRMKTIWSSKMKNSLKIRTFKAIIELILLYGSECCTIDSTMRRKIYGYYTRLLRKAIYISWKYKAANTQLYMGMPNITEVIKQRILRLSGHCIWNTDELAHNLDLWKPKYTLVYGIRNRGRQPKKFMYILKSDCDCEEDELRTPMMDREGWKAIARSG